MLESLMIKNFALIEDIEINLKDGLNALVGETGAGKSIIIEALSLLMGERSSFEKIRVGATKAFIEGNFVIENQKLIQQLNSEYDDLIENQELIVTRLLDTNLRSSIRLNGRLFPSSIVKKIMSEIVDIHSQHANLELLNEKTHLNYLDQFINNHDILDEYQQCFDKYNNEKQLLIELKNKAFSEEEIDEKKAALQEIEEINMQEGEIEHLENLAKKLHNLAHYNETFKNINALLENDDGALIKIYQAKKLLQTLKDEELTSLSDKLNDLYYQLADVKEILNNSMQDIDLENFTPEYIENRLYQLRRLLRKYGTNYNDLIVTKENIKKDLSLYSDYEFSLKEQEQKVNEAYQKVSQVALKLSELRKKEALKLSELINSQFKDLALNGADFKINFARHEPNAQGIDEISFYLSSNLGMPYAPLKSVASGGETSRIMLALKAVFFKFSNVETIIFDEIDNGVSGRIATSTGKKIQEISKTCQVIVISHLPQVVCFANNAIEVQKSSQNGSTKTTIKSLNHEEFTMAVCRLLSDGKDSSQAYTLAQELIKNSRS